MNSVHMIWATPDAEDVIAYCARVSNPDNQKEHRDLANQCLTVLQSVSPAIFGEPS